MENVWNGWFMRWYRLNRSTLGSPPTWALPQRARERGRPKADEPRWEIRVWPRPWWFVGIWEGGCGCAANMGLSTSGAASYWAYLYMRVRF